MKKHLASLVDFRNRRTASPDTTDIQGKRNGLVKHLTSLVMIVAMLAMFFAFSGTASAHTTQAAHTTRALTGDCWANYCYTLDPSAENCTTHVHLLPYNQEVDYGTAAVGWLTSAYSYDCNANWAQGTLSSYSTSRGWALWTADATIDSNNNSEQTCYPDSCQAPWYGGSTGWPTVTNMVDGTNVTHACFILYDGTYGNWLLSHCVDQ